MNKSDQDIAILFFSRSADVEADAKTFTVDGQQGQNRQIAQQLITHTHKEIAKTALPYFIVDENQQHGHSFGERFSNAFAEIFEQGFDYVIAVGNDTPQLTKEHISCAAQKLRAGFNIVLGPSTDGGVWLTGYGKEAFDEEIFRQHPWQTERLLSSLKQQNSNCLIYSLPQFGDIDSPQDLSLFLRNAPNILQSLVALLQSILSTFFGDISVSPPVELVNCFYKTTSLRAPPLV